MTRPVSIVVPSAGDVAELERALAALRAEARARDAEDQILVIDDSGSDALRRALDLAWPEVRVVARAESGGFAAAAFDGAQAADYRLMFLMHPAVVVREGALAPLVAALADEEVAAAAPRVLRRGDEDRPVARTTLAVEDGRLALHPVRELAPPGEEAPVPIPFASRAAMLVRREEFLAGGGFDRLLAPFGFEDVDLGLTAWRRGRRVVEVPGSVVELHAEDLADLRLPPGLARAAHERNRLLVHWKHLSTRREAADHLAALWRDALDAGMSGRRDELISAALALDELDAVSTTRAPMANARFGLDAALSRSSSGTRR